ncbi:hypothetical protein EI42_06344 [Thermosporothrix hazakensis]|uniref:Uncharacterized protein n=1 Tax=Thermosporothrix hazakensis TaxID=644383 RepID=A0A326TRN4_THEHA|nr:hypothetical protein EI42_06344 [Thermosporothrix hazakensis]
MQYWWVKMGYPSFSAGKDGFPRPGSVLKHYRSLKKRKTGKYGHKPTWLQF